MTSRRDRRRAPLLPGRGPLAKVPPVAVFVLVIALFGLGVWLRGPVGVVLLGVLFAGVALLLIGTWAQLRPGERVLRMLVLLVLAAVALSLIR